MDALRQSMQLGPVEPVGLDSRSLMALAAPTDGDARRPTGGLALFQPLGPMPEARSDQRGALPTPQSTPSPSLTASLGPDDDRSGRRRSPAALALAVFAAATLMAGRPRRRARVR
jgi:hypothetical protein